MEIWDFDYDSKENKLWVYSDYPKMLFQIDANINKITSIEDCIDNETKSFRGIKFFKGKIYLAPQNGNKEILIINKEKNEIKSISISEDYLPEGSQHNLFIEIVQYESMIYFIPGRYKAIICMNVETETISYIDEWFDEIKSSLNEEYNNLVIFNGVSRIDNNRLLILGWKISALLVLDLSNSNCKCLYNEQSEIGFRGATFWDDKIYLSYRKLGGIYLKKESEKNVDKVSDLHGRLYCLRDSIYLVSSQKAEIVRINPSNLNRESIDIGMMDQCKNKNGFILLAKQYDEKIILMDSNREIISIVDLLTNTVVNVDISRFELMHISNTLVKNKGIIEESNKKDFEYYLKYVSDK